MILFLGSGFIARAFAAHLLDSNLEHRIVSMDVENDPPELVKADISTLNENDHVFDEIDTVIYFAHSSVPFSSMQDIALDAKQNIPTAISLFSILAKKKIRVIYISSGGSVYGNHHGVITEDSLPVPISAYGVAKYAIENYLRLIHHNYGLPFDILRLSNVYGIGQNNDKPQGIICALARAFIAKQHFEIWGDGTAKKDYLYIDDVVSALASVLSKAASNDTFNVSCGESTSILEILAAFERSFGYQIDIHKRTAFKFDVQNVFLDNSKFANAYGWKRRIDIATGIERTIDWMTANRKA